MSIWADGRVTRPRLRPVYRTLRSPALACLALGVALSVTLSVPGDAEAANASPSAPHQHHSPDLTSPDLTPTEAKAVLSEARSVLSDTDAEPPTRSAAGDLTMTLRDLFLARSSLAGSDRRTANRILSRDAVSDRVETGAAETPTVACSTNFCVHHGTGTTAAWAQKTLDTLEEVWDAEVAYMGRRPLPDGGSPSDPHNPDGRLDVFLRDLAPQGVYGYCAGDDSSTHSQVSAYCVLDDDYSKSQYGAAPLESLKVTAAHELFHTIQFSMDIGEDLWFMEGTAVWMEDHVYDHINDHYQYLSTSPIRQPRTSLDSTSSTFPYGSFLFFTYAAERQDPALVRRFWEAAVGSTTSLPAIRGVVGASQWTSFFATFGSWNTLPVGSYSERAGYPSPVWGVSKTLTTRSPSTGVRTLGIPRLANSAVLLRPGSRLSTRKRLLVQVNGPDLASGTAAVLQRRYRDGRVTQTRIRLDAAGNGRTLVRFNRTVLRSVVVVLSNSALSGGRRGFKVRASLR